MSLLNDVLRDLQTRDAPEADPLAGLEPVAFVSPRAHRQTRIVVLLASVTLAAAILFWQPATSDADSAQRWQAATSSAGAHQQETPVANAPAALPRPAPAAAAEVAAQAEAVPQVEAVPQLVEALPARDAAPAPSAAIDPAPDTGTQVQSLPSPEAGATAQTKPEPPTGATPGMVIVRHSRDSVDTAAGGLVARGLRAVQSRDYAAAEDFFREAVAADPGDAAAWTYLYGVQSAASRPEAAERTLRRALGSAREPARIAKLYAQQLAARGETGAAIRVLQEHRPAAAGDTELDALLAALMQNQGRFAEAGDIYRQLLDRDQRRGAWWVGLALSSDSLGDHATALSAFQRALLDDALESPLAGYARRRIAELEANG